MSAEAAQVGATAGAGAGGAGAGSASAATTGWGTVAAGRAADDTHNPIRSVVESIEKPAEFINLSLGDPSRYLSTPSIFTEEVARLALVDESRSYSHSAGYPPAREAIAKRYTCKEAPLTADDVVIASGGSGALDLAISGIASPGDNIVIPCPLFPLYETLARSKRIEVHHYPLLPERNWEADLEALEKAIDSHTRAIVVNNPSNPCGNVMSKEHLLAILAIADRHHVPIIADEIYGNMTLTGYEFHPLSTLTDTVPVLTVGGLAKEFLAPGWRVGWIMVHDNKYGSFTEVRKGLFKLAMLILGANTLVQRAIPRIMDPQTEEDKEIIETSHREYMAAVEKIAKHAHARACEIPALTPTTPQGALYTMMGINMDLLEGIKDDLDFVQKLLLEEHVFVLPGKCFSMPNFFRVVNCAPVPVMDKAFDAIRRFCDNHAKKGVSIAAPVP